MRAEIVEKIGGEDRRLALPIGALEDIARVNPAIGEILAALEVEDNPLIVARFDEIKAVLDAAVLWGDEGTSFQEIYEERGLAGAADLARRLLAAAFRDDGEKKARGMGRAKANGNSVRATS